jgi:hypothetical protein
MLLACFTLSDTAKKVIIGLIEVAQSVLDNPFRSTFEPRQIGLLSSGQFFLKINGRDRFPRCFVDLLLTGKAIVVGKAGCPCTLTERSLLFHGRIKFRLVSSSDLHSSSYFITCSTHYLIFSARSLECRRPEIWSLDSLDLWHRP